PTRHEAALLERLGEGWTWNHVVKTGIRRSDGPGSYKIDLANVELKIAIEVDGASHNSDDRREQDARKSALLESLGWSVVRIANNDVSKLTGELLEELVYRCPVEAEVIAVDMWEQKDPYVYDIDVEGLHNFYADGVVVHNCQDSNAAQVTLATQLAKDHRNYMVVGDPGQAIFSFRGSDPQFLTEFPGEWDAKVVTLSKNYRSGKAIVDVANAIIREGAHRLPDDMTSERGIEGKVEVVSAETLDDEASELVDFCKKRVASGQSLADVTCLFRLNAQSRALEEALLREKMPYVLIGGVNFYERKAVKDLLAYLRLAAGKDAEGDALKRCINAPFRFLGAKFVERVMAVRNASVEHDWVNIVDQASRQEGIQQRQRD